MGKKIVKYYLKFVEAVCVILLLVIFCLMMIQISCRLLSVGQNFTEELSRLCFCVMVFFGAPLVLAEGSDICVDMVVNQLPKSVQRIVEAVVNVFIIIFSAFCLKSVTAFIASNVGVTAVSMTWLMMNWIYFAVMASFVFLLIVSVMKLVAIVRGVSDVIDINAEEKERAKKEEQELDLGI